MPNLSNHHSWVQYKTSKVYKSLFLLWHIFKILLVYPPMMVDND